MNTRIILAAVAALSISALATPADARRAPYAQAAGDLNIHTNDGKPAYVQGSIDRRTAPRARSRSASRKAAPRAAAIPTPKADPRSQSPGVAVTNEDRLRKTAEKPAWPRGFANAEYCPRKGGSTAIAPLVGPLKAKVIEIVSACGSKVISTGCRGGKTPNHREWKAADLKGNPSCIYAHLKGWPGGYSTDYGAVQHVHISYNRAHEWGYRFAHGGSDVRRFARHGRTRYASANHTPPDRHTSH